MTVVAIVPAKDRADTIAATVAAVRGLSRVDRVLVVDDGSTDDTAPAARAAGADVLRLPSNRGKGGAVLAGVDAVPDADVFLLVDADLAATAGAADALLDAVLGGDADLAIGVLPSAGKQGGFGTIRRLAAEGIRRATGLAVRAPLSGQRAVRAEFLRGLEQADRFGLEVAMTIDAARRGARIVEVDVSMDHRHTGRRLSGFVHRGRQGADIVRALWPRLTTPAARHRAMAVTGVVVLLALAWSGSTWSPSSAPPSSRARKVVVFGMSPMGFGDIGRGVTPNLDALMAQGSVAAMSVRTVARAPSLAGGYLSLGAGARLHVSRTTALAYDGDAEIPGGTAAEVLEARTGESVTGAIAAVGATSAVELNDGPEIASPPGALGDALVEAGLEAAAIGNADQPATVEDEQTLDRSVALAVMTSRLEVGAGTVSPRVLLDDDPASPFGVRADHEALLAAFDDALRLSDVVALDPGDLERADRFSDLALEAAAAEHRDVALRRTDALLGAVVDRLPDDAMLLVVSVSPPGRTFRLTPLVVAGAGVPSGSIVSPSTKRIGVAALTDLAPTILDALDVPVPDDMPGNALRYRAGEADMGHLRDLDRDTNLRERTYYPQAVGFIVFQAIIYVLALLVLSRKPRTVRGGSILRVAVLAAAAYPLTTYLALAVPNFSALGPAGVGVCVAAALAIALVASRARRTPLSGLNWIMASTVALIVFDAASGTRLHISSWLGYSLHSAGRFYGIPNTTFALLAAGTLLLACAHVQFAPRRREALFTVIVLFAIVLVADGAPMLGGDVGGIVALVPLFGLTVIALRGGTVRWRTIALVVALTAVVIAIAAGVDLMRPDESRTHLGRFADELFNDPGELVDTFLRKQAANLRILRGSIWTWMIPVIVGFLLYVLAWERGFEELLPPRSPARIGAIAVVGGALLGFAANDSGPIVIVLFFVYLLPFLTLLALRRAEGEPELLPAEPT